MAIEGIGLAAQALQKAEQTKQTSGVHAVALRSEAPPSPQKLSAADYQARMKLKETPLDLNADRQLLQQALSGSAEVEIPAALQLSPRFQNFVSQFFSQTPAAASPVSQEALQMQAMLLNRQRPEQV